ncbi:MAG TPA: hypothetical protein VHK27_05525 [Gammaproteobacteria bacterium]|nr:hypothetical protein [Gammaproteobacteria bacterium]
MNKLIQPLTNGWFMVAGVACVETYEEAVALLSDDAIPAMQRKQVQEGRFELVADEQHVKYIGVRYVAN